MWVRECAAFFAALDEITEKAKKRPVSSARFVKLPRRHLN